MHVEPSTPPPSNLSKAEQSVTVISRAAAKTVRVALENGNETTARQVVSSLIYSTKRYSSGEANGPVPQHIAIDFGQAVPPRLAFHSLFHGLLRKGDTKEAIKVAHRMQQLGIRTRQSTLELAFNSLAKPSPILKPSTLRITNLGNTAHIIRKFRDFTELTPQKAHCAEIGLATQIFFAAKEYQKQRTKSMFRSLVNACMLQGEIVIFTFLFAFMLNQWQRKNQLTPIELSEEEERKLGTAARKLHPSILREFKWENLGYKYWFPEEADIPFDEEYLLSLLDLIKHALSSEGVNPTRRRHALQALATLANIFDAGLLPTGEVARLIGLMSVHSAHETVWVYNRGRWKAIFADNYFNSIIARYIQAFLEPDSSQPTYEPPTRRTWNTLLSHALRKSEYELAERIGERVLMQESKETSKDIVAYNVLLHSSRLLRRPEIAKEVLDRLRKNPANIKLGVPFDPPDTEDGIPMEASSNDLEGVSEDIASEDIEPNSDPEATNEPLVDHYTLASYISHLTATGRPHVVAPLLFHLIPELKIIDHPAIWSHRRGPEISRDLRAEVDTFDPNLDKWVQRYKATARAVNYGPYFFTVVLHALNKAGKTGLAERVWLLAKRAERASWMEVYYVDGVIKPWCLSIHAYTCMMQIYADEMKKGMNLRRYATELQPQVEPSWEPKNTTVRGWALLAVIANRKGEDGKLLTVEKLSQRDIAAMSMAKILYQSMVTGARMVLDSLEVFNEDKTTKAILNYHHLRPPRHDPPFFKAALAVFGRHQTLVPRATMKTRTYYKRLYRRALERFVRKGELPRTRSNSLAEVLLAMKRAKCRIPLTFRPLFIGKDPIEEYTPPKLELEDAETNEEEEPPLTIATITKRGRIEEKKPRRHRAWKRERGRFNGIQL